MPDGRGRTAQKSNAANNITNAKKATGDWHYDQLFISANSEAIRDTSNIHDLGKQKKDLVFNDQKFNAMKIAFEPLGQGTPNEAQITLTEKWKEDLMGGSKWPSKVPGFEMWAEATAYDPTKANGGEKFQNMLVFLLVDGGGDCRFTNKPYYDLEKGRGKGWYINKGDFKGTPHSFNLHHEAWNVTGAWHTPKTQGLVNLPNDKDVAMVGGKAGALSAKSNGFVEDEQIGTTTTGAPHQPGSKLNWLYHCFGALVSKEGDNKGGSHSSATSFVTTGILNSCHEAEKSCTALGNTLAAIIGLYYYPGCEKYNWVAKETPIEGGKSYDIRMRMWNPTYELADDNSLLVLEPINAKWLLNKTVSTTNPNPFVGSNTKDGTLTSGFELAHVYKQSNALAKDPKKETPPQPLKQLLHQSTINDEKNIVASISPWVGSSKEDKGKFVIQSVKLKVDNKKYLNNMHKHLGHVVNKPDNYEDGLCFGFKVPKAHFLYPQWDNKKTVEHVDLTTEFHSNIGTGFQPVPKWRRGVAWLDDDAIDGYKLRVTGQVDQANASWTDENAKAAKEQLVSEIQRKGLAIALLDIKTESNSSELGWSVPALNNIAHALEEDVVDDEQEVEQVSDDELEALSRRDLQKLAKERGVAANMSSVKIIAALRRGSQADDAPPPADDAPPPAPPPADDDAPELPLDKNEENEGEESNDDVEKPEGTTFDDVPETDTGGKEVPAITPHGILSAESGEEPDLRVANQVAANNLARATREHVIKKDLEPGAVRRPDIDANEHFTSSEKQPWPHKDIYLQSKLEIVPGKVMDNAALEKFKEDYGSTKNCYLRGQSLPTKIVDIKKTYGDAQNIIHTNLFKNTDVHKRNMCKILAIYFEKGDMGGKRQTMSPGKSTIKANQKQYGFEHGIRRQRNGTLFQSSQTGEILWPAVFNEKPPSELKMTVKDINLTLDFTCESEPFKRWFKEHKEKGPMTVLEWVTSPWHYLFLPYHRRNLLFEDGETYSEGCTRCSRPFFEYEYMYSWFLEGPAKTAHWPTAYWCVSTGSQGACDKTKAPKPFHDPDFWQTPQGKPQTRKRDTTVLNDSDTDDSECEDLPPTERGNTMSGKGAGWHNWPTKAFKFGPIIKGKGVIHKETRGEWEKKLKFGLTDGIIYAASKEQDLLFKRYHNHAYRPDRLEFWKGAYPTYPQSRPAASQAKLQLGMQDYNLQRASKYGNVCHDCATVLELAPGLLVRKFRKVKYTIGSLKPKLPSEEADGNSYWTNLLQQVKDSRRGPLQEQLLQVDELLNFDIDDLTVDKELRKHKKGRWNTPGDYDESFQRSMRTYSRLIADQQNVDLGRSGKGAPLTKFNSPPDIYLPKQIDLKSGKIGEIDHEQIKEAVKFLQDMRPTYRGTKVVMPGFWTDTDAAAVRKRKQVSEHPAFQHMIFELERKYMHMAQFERDTENKVFDSEMTRLESRNVSRTLNGKKYNNCLEIKYLSPPVKVGNRLQPQQTTVKTYYYDRTHGTPESGSNDETMWRGDDYATTQGTGNRQLLQYRKMRQSRLFVTYSLHRATTSEDEARFLMMRMADAAHCLFGNDQNLSELLVFGYKVVPMGKVDGVPDSLSKGGFEVITNPKKKDQEANFYGGEGSSSYIYDTYQTHVDKVDVDGGIEIGPQRHHPHFHILLTINHYSYIQLDYFKMNAYLEMMFKGIDKLCKGWGDKFKLLDASGNLFYTDNENPYVDIKLYPQDNWNDIIAAYVRKNATPGPIEAARVARDEILPA